MKEIIHLADLVLIPTTPSRLDLFELENPIQFVRESNSRAIVRIVGNRMRRRTLLTDIAFPRESERFIAPHLNQKLSERECYSELLDGIRKGGFQSLPREARTEIAEFYREVVDAYLHSRVLYIDSEEPDRVMTFYDKIWTPKRI